MFRIKKLSILIIILNIVFANELVFRGKSKERLIGTSVPLAFTKMISQNYNILPSLFVGCDLYISKGFEKWTKMSKELAPDAEKNGIKMIWAGTNPDETEVYAVLEVQDPIQMKTFGEREDIARAREEAGADVSSTKIISTIGKDYMPE